jgi:hypothetical protein
MEVVWTPIPTRSISLRNRLLAAAGATAVAIAVVPSIGASAAELGNGTYEPESNTALTVTVSDDGIVVIGDGVEDVTSFVLTVDDTSYTLAKDAEGVWAATETLDEPTEEGTGEATEEPAEETGEESDEPVDDGVETDDETGDEADDEAEAGRGAVVSTVAACAPRGREAREAGWPNHGTFVSAAARGEALTWTVVDEDGEQTFADVDLSTLEGATAFCAVVTTAFSAPAVEDTTVEESSVEDTTDAEDASVESPDDSVDSADDDSMDEDSVDDPSDDGEDDAKAEKRQKPEKGERGRSADAPGRSGRSG